MGRLRILQAPFEETAFGYTPEAVYSVVWEEEVEGDLDLEAIWTRFQRVDPVDGPWPPEGFEGRSLSIGDLIEIDGRRWTPVAVGFAEVGVESAGPGSRRVDGFSLSEQADEPEHDCLAEGALGFVATYAAPGFGQAWECERCGREWAKIGGSFVDPSTGAHLLDPEDVR